jgi:hypothetical protein
MCNRSDVGDGSELVGGDWHSRVGDYGCGMNVDRGESAGSAGGKAVIIIAVAGSLPGRGPGGTVPGSGDCGAT